jgi:hypothetical protein
MMVSRFTKAFQMIALVLVFSVTQLYVMATPTKAHTDPKATDKSSVTQPAAETVAAEPATDAPNAASEKMPLTAGTKTMLTRIFSRSNVEARLAAGNTFLSTKASAAEMFKSSRKSAVPAQTTTDDDDDDEGTKRGVWIAVGVLAAVITIAVIGFRADRNRSNDND